VDGEEGALTTPAGPSGEPLCFLDGLRTALDRTSGANAPPATIPVGVGEGNAGEASEPPPTAGVDGSTELLAIPMVSSVTPAAIPPAPTTSAADTANGYYDDGSDSSDEGGDFEPTPSDDTEARSGVFTAGQWDKMHAHLVARAVTAQTEVGYQRLLRTWHQFLASLPEAQRPGSLLLAVTSSFFGQGLIRGAVQYLPV
jgi:hypothetical protein